MAVRSSAGTVGVIGLVLYGLVATGSGAAPATGRAQVAGSEWAPLETALEATGAHVERVRVAGWVEVHDSQAINTGRKRLDSVRVSGESVQVQTPKRGSSQYMSVSWLIEGPAARQRWQTVASAVREALAEAGATPMVTVQLEGVAPTKRAAPETVVEQALEPLSVTGRQVWHADASASIAARTIWLPASPLGVNVQAAARRESETGRLRVWVAWPALIQEY